MKSPIRYPGGKGNHVKKLLSLMPPHDAYCEVFGGGASLLFAKAPTRLDVYNDLNYAVVTLFKVLRCDKQYEQLQQQLELTPYAFAEYMNCRDVWWKDHSELSDVEIARRTYVAARQGFCSRQHTTGWAKSTKLNHPQNIEAWCGSIELLPEIHNRLRSVYIECCDYKHCIEAYDQPGMLMYLDPPYYGVTGVYIKDFNEQDQEKLIEYLVTAKLQSKIMLSNYGNDLYDMLLHYGWHAFEFETHSFTLASKRVNSNRTEVVYMNYDPEVLIGSTG